MGVVVRIDAYIPSGFNPAQAFRAAFDRVAMLERRFSSYLDDSELRRIERRAWREPVAASPEFVAVLDHALEVAAATGGAFDPTVGQVTRLARERGLPATADDPAWTRAWRLTGWRSVLVDPQERTVRLLRKGLQFDFGGIAKGYIADRALGVLGEAGISRAKVSVAGDIAVSLPPPGEAGWPIGLDAAGPRGAIDRVVILRNQGVSTSGSRERYYEAPDGGRCAHIVAAGQGLCTDASIAVSVVAPTGMEADAWATALIGLGPAKSRTLVAELRDVEVYWTRPAVAHSATGESR